MSTHGIRLVFIANSGRDQEKSWISTRYIEPQTGMYTSHWLHCITAQICRYYSVTVNRTKHIRAIHNKRGRLEDQDTTKTRTDFRIDNSAAFISSSLFGSRALIRAMRGVKWMSIAVSLRFCAGFVWTGAACSLSWHTHHDIFKGGRKIFIIQWIE